MVFAICRFALFPRRPHVQCSPRNSEHFFPPVCGQDGRGKGLSASRGGGPGQGGVSVWRQLLVANEWNRLGTRRRVNPACSLVWMAFVLGAGRLRYNATPQPDLADTEASKGMRFGLCLPTLLFSCSRGRAIGGVSSVVADGRACANSAHASSERFQKENNHHTDI